MVLGAFEYRSKQVTAHDKLSYPIHLHVNNTWFNRFENNGEIGFVLR